MSEDQAVPTGTQEALGEIQEAVKLLAANKGKPSKGLNHFLLGRWSQSIAKVFSDASCQLEPVLQSLASLPPTVAALGVVRAWPSMSEDRRNVYLRWLDTLDSDRSGSQKAVLIPQLLESSPATSVELLCNVSLANQDLKHRLASTLLGESMAKCKLLLVPDAPEYKVRKVVTCLLQLSEANKVPAEVRRDTIRFALSTLVSHKLHQGSLGIPLLDLIKANLSNLPPIFKNELSPLLGDIDVGLSSGCLPGPAIPPRRADPSAASEAREDIRAVGTENPPPGAPPQVGQESAAILESPSDVSNSERSPASSPGSRSAREVPSDVSETDAHRRPRLLSDLADWLTTLRGRTRLLEELHRHIEDLEARRAYLEGEVRAAGAKEKEALTSAAKSAEDAASATERIRTLELRLSQACDSTRLAEERAASLEGRLTTAMEREAAVQEHLRLQEDRAARERTDLQQRIQTNADRRLEEFRTALTSSLARLFHGLPRRGSPVSAELGEVILTRLHEVIAFFESKGIRVNSGQGDQR